MGQELHEVKRPSIRRRMTILLGQINTYQTPIWFDMPIDKAVAVKRQRQVHLLTMGNMHNCFAVMLCCTADKHTLPPFLLFKRKTIPTRQKFMPKFIMQVNEKFSS